MRIEVVPTGAFAENAIFLDDGRGSVAIVDPGQGAASVFLERLKRGGQTPVAIYLTHSHWDHIVDVYELKHALNIPVFIHPLDEKNLIHPGSDGLPLAVEIQGVTPDAYLHDGDKVQFGTVEFEVIHTPGHSPGGVCFYFEKEGVLISGDTLFHGSIGNLSFPTAQVDKMWTSLERLAKLPHETRVIPGHGEETTIGAEGWLKDAKQLFGG